MRFTLSLAAAAMVAGTVCAQNGTFTTSGSGCPLFGSFLGPVPYMLLPAGQWSLDGRSLTLIPTGTDWVVTNGGAYIAPSMGATAIATGDDVVRGPFALPFSFLYPGGNGITSSIDASSNGHVYLEAGTNTDNRCCDGDRVNFLAATPSIAPFGTDLNPGAGGSWTFDVQTVGPDMVALVTWDNVPEFSRGGSNTVQCQLWSTGQAVIAIGVTNGNTSTHQALVGASPGGGVMDPGPTTFNPAIWLAASTLPNVGNSLTITANQVPPGATLGALQFGSLQTNLPLSLIGTAPGCDLLVDNIFFSAPMTVAPPTATTMFSIVSGVGLTIQLQAFIGDLTQAGTYPIPVFVSDRGTMTIGQSNNECAGAFAITNGVTAGTTVGSTTSAPTGSCGSMGNDVWYAYTATCTGTATVSTCPADGGSATFDSVIAAFSGACGSLVQLACNDDSCGLQSRITFAVTAGTTYYIAVGEFQGNNVGTFNLFVGCQ
jgi:hypothetical protein